MWGQVVAVIVNARTAAAATAIQQILSCMAYVICCRFGRGLYGEMAWLSDIARQVGGDVGLCKGSALSSGRMSYVDEFGQVLFA